MRKTMRILKSIMVLALILAFFLVTGCSKYASKEQMAELENQKAATLAAEKKVENLKQKKEDCEKESAKSKKELDALKKDLSAIQE